jgi:hypothetical protein
MTSSTSPHEPPGPDAARIQVEFGGEAFDQAHAGSLLQVLWEERPEQVSRVDRSFTDERFRVDQKPRLTVGRQDVAQMEIAVGQDGLLGRAAERFADGHRMGN